MNHYSFYYKTVTKIQLKAFPIITTRGWDKSVFEEKPELTRNYGWCI